MMDYMVNVEEVFNLRISTEHFMTANTVAINKNSLAQKAFSGEVSRLDIKMKDISGRPLDIYGSLYVGQGGSISLSFWVPYWIVNKSGIPLIIKQEASSGVAAGQFEEHERAKDRHPLMFSFAYDNCPTQCKIRVGKKFLSDPSYKPMFSEKFQLTLGVQALKLFVTHDHLATLIYNIGVEVRQGTGRYKDTQVVLLTPRYLLNNQSSYELSLSHVDYIDQPSQHVRIASKCNLVWNENFEDKRMLCIKRSDVEHWSCPFRIDRITSFHVTMRAADETPCFVRVEIILNSAVFCVTFTDAQYFPPPIQIENFSDVPILYHQKIEKSKWSHLRAICKANSTVDYAWDDHHAAKLLVLQVFENKSNIYDPQKPGHGPPLIYDNDVYIKFVQSFERLSSHDGFTDECELVLEVMRNGKVKLNKMNPSDSTHSQLWRFSNDGCLENMAMNNRAKVGERYVLDVLDKAGYVLMMSKRNSARDQFQKWEMSATKQLKCGVQGMAVEVRADEILLARPHPRSQRNSQGVPLEQLWELQSQRPGSGVLDVECLHKGPTLVIRISDRANSMKERISRPLIKIGSAHRSSSSFTKQHLYDIEVSVSLIAGIGVSLVNGQHEELLYARFSNISLVANRSERTFQITSSVEAIQIDNQLLSADHWQVLYCQFSAVTNEIGQSSSQVKRPALKLEMKCTPMLHYDAFDCFRLKICDIALHLDELLLWKIVQFFQESGTAGSVQPNAFLQPPNTDLYRPDPLQARRCYFGTLDLEIGRVALSVVTVPKSGLPRELRALKRQFNVKLVSFENAIIALPPFRQFRYFETFSFLVETLSKFYIAHLKNQTFNIVVTMDAFGNPSGLASDLKDSFEGLLFEGDLSGFVSSLGYGVTNSISKVASSMAYGVGSLTFDEQHEVMRQRMLHTAVPSESSNALAHLYSGVKGLGVGVFGGLTAIVTNTYTEGRKAGLTGAIKGLTTGAVDTVTKPVQGIFDLVEGTASAVKEMVGGPSARKSRFPERPIRLPRVCMNLQLLLPCYSSTLASNQLDLLRINGFTRNEVLLDVELLLDQPTHSGRFRQYALICSEQCYIIRRIENEPSNVIQRISYKNLKQIQPISGCETPLVSLEVVLELSNGKRQVLPPLWCGQIHIAKVLCDKVMRAKELYEHSKRTLAVAEEFDGF
ncbi:hypothetical protein AB6A40_004986 [Gnathostoma spinigerum]|uniref:Vacuolar protein sorting-associated protein 13 VPS13 adaptor binding domain-containing protein n=1 Tax=Gnathostoma spinigerum TaxID=75299 RepID=A0ABD6EP07_9BILA